MILSELNIHLAILIQLLMALALGSAIGYERQVRQRMAGLRTNALVALGSAAFVVLGMLTPDEISPTRVAAQVVSGIGFLCAGVIMRDGLNVRGLNTAATLWCSSAVGVLAGMGFLVESVLVAIAVVGANTALRPISRRIRKAPIDEQSEVATIYQLMVTCRVNSEAHIRALLLHVISNSPLEMRGLHSESIEGTDKVKVYSELHAFGAQNKVLEQLVSRLSLEDSVTAVSWTLDPEKDESPAPLAAAKAGGPFRK